MKRGQYKRKNVRQTNPAIADITIERLVETSPLKDPEAKVLIAHTIIAMSELLQRLRMLNQEGTLTAIEAGRMPALSSNIRRGLESLGKVKLEEDDVVFGDEE